MNKSLGDKAQVVAFCIQLEMSYCQTTLYLANGATLLPLSRSQLKQKIKRSQLWCSSSMVGDTVATTAARSRLQEDQGLDASQASRRKTQAWRHCIPPQMHYFRLFRWVSLAGDSGSRRSRNVSINKLSSGDHTCLSSFCVSNMLNETKLTSI